MGPPSKVAEWCDGRIQAMAEAIDDPRFVPHVVLHEFETWVIAAALGTSHVLGDSSVAKKLQEEARKVVMTSNC